MTNTRSFRFLLLATAAAATLAGGAPAGGGQTAVRSLSQEVALGGAAQVHVNLSIGDLTVEGTDGGNVEIELTLDCNRVDPEVCKARAEKVRLAPRMGKRELKIKLKNTHRPRLRGIKARMTVRMPRHVPLEVDVTGGDIHISGMRSHMNVNSGGGNVDVVAERRNTNEVEIDIGFGKGDLWLGEERIKATGWPRALKWKGTGDAKIEIDVVGGGNVSVRLE